MKNAVVVNPKKRKKIIRLIYWHDKLKEEIPYEYGLTHKTFGKEESRSGFEKASTMSIAEIADIINDSYLKFGKMEYKDRLNMWYSLGLSYHWDCFYSITNYILENGNQSVSISITPSNEVEDDIYVNWLLEKLSITYPLTFSVGHKTGDFLNILQNNPQKVRLLESKLKFIESRLADAEESEGARDDYWAYGFYSVVHSNGRLIAEDKRSPVFNLCRGAFLCHLPEILQGHIEAQVEPLYITELNKAKGISTTNHPIDAEVAPSITLEKEAQKVMLLHELGIFEFLKTRYNITDNDTKLARIVEGFTGIKKDTIRQPYRAITGKSPREANNPYNNQDNIQVIENVFNQLGLPRRLVE